MRLWQNYKPLCVCYGLLALGMIAVLLGAPDHAIAISALPGAITFLVYFYRYVDEQVTFILRMLRD
jgi:hypothetical protein